MPEQKRLLIADLLSVVPAFPACLFGQPSPMVESSAGVVDAREGQPRYFDLACRRLEQAYAQPRLPLVERTQPVQQALLGVG